MRNAGHFNDPAQTHNSFPQPRNAVAKIAAKPDVDSSAARHTTDTRNDFESFPLTNDGCVICQKDYHYIRDAAATGRLHGCDYGLSIIVTQDGHAHGAQRGDENRSWDAGEMPAHPTAMVTSGALAYFDVALRVACSRGIGRQHYGLRNAIGQGGKTMSSVEHSIFINAPVDTVFDALLRVEESPRWVVGLEEVRDVTGRNVGDTFAWTFKMAGTLIFRGTTTFAAIEPGRYLREEGSGDLSNVWSWRLTPELSGTQVHVRIDYTVPGGALIGGILDKLFVERQNQKDLEQSLSNLKQMLEG